MEYRRIIVFITIPISVYLNSCDTKSTIYGPPDTVDYTPSDSAISYFLADAVDFAVDYLHVTNSSDTGLISVPDSVLDLYLIPLSRLYDSRSDFPILDTLIGQRHVHRYVIWSVRTIVLADTSEAWVRNVKNQVSPTGNSVVDSLIALYNLEIEASLGWGYSGQTWLNVSHPPLNSHALAHVFTSIPGVARAQASFVSYTLSDLKVILYSEATLVHLLYSTGIPGANEAYQWSFSIDKDNNVEYLGHIPL